jgi:Mg2+-importing ATPase
MSGTGPPAADQPFWSTPLPGLFLRCRTGEQGLSREEARIRLRRYGPNRLKPKREVNAAKLFFRQFTSPIILILLFAAVLSFFLGDVTDSTIIMVIVIFSGALGFWQEYEASSAVEDLMALVQLKAMVIRDSREAEVPFEEVVPGDIVVLNAGDGVPGDGRIIASKDLFVNEAALTGESYPVEKSPADLPAETGLAKRTNSLFMGTHVISGSAKMLVTSMSR